MTEYLRIPLTQSMNEAIDLRIKESIQRIGGPLPCTIKSVSGAIVTVDINVEGPVWPPVVCTSQQSPYVREPLQPGDTGVIFPCLVDIGNISGLGSSGNSSVVEQPNLSAMVFMPTGSKNFPSVDGNKVVIRGPSGVQTGSLSGGAVMIHDSGGITIMSGNITIMGGSTNITGGDVTADGISLKLHVHTDPQGGDTGPPV